MIPAMYMACLQCSHVVWNDDLSALSLAKLDIKSHVHVMHEDIQ